MELNQISNKASWGKSTSDLNDNFSKIGADIEKVKNATTKNKGYFSTSDELTSMFTSANVGDIAYVKSDTYTPFERWRWNGSAWEATGEAGGNDNVELGNYYTQSEIDGKFTDTETKLSELGSEVGEKIADLASYVNYKTEIVSDGTVNKGTVLKSYRLTKGNTYRIELYSDIVTYNGSDSTDRMVEIRAVKANGSTVSVLYVSKSKSGKELSVVKNYNPDEDVTLNLYTSVEYGNILYVKVIESSIYNELLSEVNTLKNYSCRFVTWGELAGNVVTIDTENMEFTLKSNTVLYTGASAISSPSYNLSCKLYVEGDASGTNYIIYNTSNATLYPKVSMTAILDSELVLALIVTSYGISNKVYKGISLSGGPILVDGIVEESLNKIQSDVKKTFSFIDSQSYAPRKDVTISSYTLNQGVEYVLEIDSDTGINEYSGTEEQSLWIEIRQGGKIIYSLSKNSAFVRKTIYYTPQSSGSMIINPSRYGDNERLKLTLYTKEQYNNIVRNSHQVFSDEEKIRIKNNLGIFSAGESTSELNEKGVNFIRTAQTKVDSYGSNGWNRYLSFLQMTDTHADWERVNRCFAFASEDCIDNVIHTGDIVESSGQFSSYDWKSNVLACTKPVLAIVGNHEMQHIINPASSYKAMTDQQVFDLLYNDELVSHNGEIHPIIDGLSKNYYHKDVTKNGYTIRLIALYQYEWDSPVDDNGDIIYGDGNGKDIVLYSQEQINWFVETLKSTPSEYGVIIISHSLISKAIYEDCPFNEQSLRKELTSTQELSARQDNQYFFGEIIKSYINGGSCSVATNQITPDGEYNNISVNDTFVGGGKVIANICGHRHSGGVMKLVDKEDNPIDCRVVMASCSCSQDGQNTGWWGRHSQGKLQDNLHVTVYDNDLDLVRVVKIGANINHDLDEVNSYSF